MTSQPPHRDVDGPQDRVRAIDDPTPAMPVIGPPSSDGQVVPTSGADGRGMGAADGRGQVRRLPGENQFVSVFGNVVRHGSWSLADTSTAVMTFGDVSLDLREADWSDETRINGYGCFGDLKIIVPLDVEVQMRGLAIFGDRKVNIERAATSGPRRLLVIDGFSLFGDVKVLALAPGDKPPKRWRWF